MKNLQELAKRFEEQKIQYAYGNFQLYRFKFN